VRVDAVNFQCSRAILRSTLWDPHRYVKRASLTSTGTILAEFSGSAIDWADYDRDFAGTLKTTLY